MQADGRPDHPAQLRHPTDASLQRWREHLDAAAPFYCQWGVEILNASPISALTAYRKVTVETACRPLSIA
jgi:hypothetical protein